MNPADSLFPACRRPRARVPAAALLAVTLAAVSPHARAGTSDTFSTGSSLLKNTNYTSQSLPGNTTDVSLTTTSTALTISGGSVTMESLTASAGRGYALTNGTASTPSTLTLGNGGTFTNANNTTANDLIAVSGAGSSLTITSTATNSLALTLTSSGNFDNTASGTGLTISANIGESGGARTLTLSGTGTSSFTGTNSFSGGLVVTGGELDVSSDASLGAAPSSVANDITINGGRLGSNSNLTFTINANRTILLGSTATTTFSVKGTGDVTYNGVFADLSTGGVLIKQGGGILDVGGVSTYTGNTSVNNGTLRLNGANLLPAGTVLNIGQGASPNLGTFDLNGNNQTVAGLASTSGTSASATLTNVVTSTAAAALTINAAGGTSYAYGGGTAANSGVISGAVSLVKSGAGTQTLGGANTYTGTTLVNGGGLQVTNASGSGTGTGAVTVGTGGTLLGTGFISSGANQITVNGTLSPGAGTGSAGTINLASTASAGALTLAGTSTLAFDLTSASSKDLVALGGSSLALNGGTLALTLPNTTATGIDYAATYAVVSGVSSLSGTGFGRVTGYDTADYMARLSLDGTAYDLSFTPVPEPATVFGGLLLAGAVGWRQRRSGGAAVRRWLTRA